MSKKEEEIIESKLLTVDMIDRMLYQTYLHYKGRLDKGKITPGELTALNTFLKNNGAKIQEIEQNGMQSLVDDLMSFESEAVKKLKEEFTDVSNETEEKTIGS